MPRDVVKSQSMARQAYNILKNEVMEGTYLPGDKISEQDVADRLRISRSPVREAIRQLSNEGLVDYFPNRGAYIKIYTSKDVHDCFAVRLLLETYAIEHIDPAMRETLLLESEALIRKIQTADRQENDELDVQVHELAIRMSGNQMLLYLYRLLYSRIGTFRTISVQEDDMFRLAQRSHLALLRALQKNDTNRAVHVVTKHLEESEEKVQLYYNGK